MVALFLDDNKTNDDADGKEIGKNDMFIITNNNFARASHSFVHFFAVVAQHKNCPFHFLYLDDVTYGPEENFAKICQIK